MRTVHTWSEPNAAYPVADETRILSGREVPIRLTLRDKKEFSALSVRHKEVVIDRLPGLFGDLEPYRLAGLLLANRRSLNIAISSTLRATTSQPRSFAVDSEIEHRQVALSVDHLKLRTDRPDVSWPQRRLSSGQLALIPRGSLSPTGVWVWLSCMSFSGLLRMTSMVRKPLPALNVKFVKTAPTALKKLDRVDTRTFSTESARNRRHSWTICPDCIIPTRGYDSREGQGHTVECGVGESTS
jgi:hypothetical protein